nr:transposase (putative), gypsy type [Tanacetum cinerariifolium]
MFFLQKAFDAFCEKFHIPEKVHLVLPNRGDTIHERPAGKIRLYTRFFDFANFRLPLSTFLVDILRYFRINISQLYIIGAAKVSHFEIMCRVYEIVPTVGLFRCFYMNSKKNGWISFSKCSDNVFVCYMKPLDSLKNWNDYFFWVDSFACPALFPLHTSKNMTRDPAPVAADFNARDYATLDPTKVKIVKRERVKDELLLLQTTVGRTVPLLLVAPDRANSELETSIDKLFDKGGSDSQARKGGFAGVGEGTNVQPITEAIGIVTEDVAPLHPRRQRKRKIVVVDAGGSSHPPKKLSEDHETPSGPFVAGKSRSPVQRLLVGAGLNANVMGETIPTFPFVTSSVSATLERDGGDHTDSVTGLNLRTISASQRFVISSNSSHHSGANVAEAEVDFLVRSSVSGMTTITITTSTADPVVIVKEKTVKPSLFAADSSFAGGVDPNAGKVYVPRWSVNNGSCFDDDHVCREMVDEFARLKFFLSIRGMEHDQLFTEFNVEAARQMSLSAKVRMRAKYNIKKKRRLKSAVEEKDELLKARDKKIENPKTHMVLKEAEDVEAIRLRAKASNFVTVEKSLSDEVVDLEASAVIKEREMTDLSAQLTSIKSHSKSLVDQVASSILQEKLSNYKNLTERLKEFQDAQLKVINDKFDKMYANFVKLALHLEERFYPHLLTTISSRRWLLTHGIELDITKCLHSSEYLSALRAAIDRLFSGITHGAKGRVLTDVAAYNPSAEAEYISALQRLQNVNFPLLAKLRSNKDASVDILMNILRREETLAERLVVVGASALSLALDVSSSRVQKVKENIANHISALRDVFVPFVELVSTTALTGMEGTSNVISATANTTTALSTTLASASIVAPISVDDYEVTGMDDQAGADGNVDPFPNVDDAELNIVWNTKILGKYRSLHR